MNWVDVLIPLPPLFFSLYEKYKKKGEDSVKDRKHPFKAFGLREGSLRGFLKVGGP